MVYFDQNYLKQYLSQGKPLKVYVNGEYYDIADATDLESSAYGLGYNNNGKPTTFAYTDIQQIKSGEHILTLDQLQQKTGQGGGEEADAEPAPDAGGGDDMSMPEPPTGGGEEPPMDMPEEEPEEEPEPPQESVRRVFSNMLNESRDKEETHGMQKGDFVQNVDSRCEYFGSRGTITKIEDKDTEHPMVTYRVFNLGFNFKPNQKVTKNINYLRKIDTDG